MKNNRLNRLWATLIVCMVFSMGVISAETLYERNTNGADDDVNAATTTWYSQTFTIGTTGTNVNFLSTKITLNISNGDGATFNVSIQNVNASGAPSGADLCSATNITAIPTTSGYMNFSCSGTTLSSSTKYAIVMRASSSFIKMNRQATGSYSGGEMWRSLNSGTTGSWYVESLLPDLIFQVWGNQLFPPEINYTLDFNATTYESNVESFNVNINYNSSAWSSLFAYLNYNGSAYQAMQTGSGDALTFYKNLTIPSISAASETKNLYWIFNLTNSSGTTTILSPTSTQTVNKGTILSTGVSCPVNTLASINFTFAAESNLTGMNGTASYYFTYGLTNTSTYILNATVSNVNGFSICINKTQEYYNVGYGEIQYSVNTTGFSQRRFYIFENTRLTNITTFNVLYGLESTSSTSFQITAETTTLAPYTNSYISLMRWYPELASYKIVEMGKTDSKGQTVLKVKTEDVDYRIGVYQSDGTLIKLLDPIRMICQTNPCVYSIFVDVGDVDLTNIYNIQQSLTYNNNTKIFTFIWNDPSQDTKIINLTVWKDGAASSTVVCSVSATAFTGILNCDTTGSTGILRAEVWRSASPAQLIDQLIKEIRTTFISVGGGTLGLFFGVLLLIFMALAGIASPILVLIMGMVALIPLLFLGNITITLFMAVGILAGVVIHFMSRIT